MKPYRNPLLTTCFAFFALSGTAQIASDETPFLEHELLLMIESDVESEKVLTSLKASINFDVLGVPSPSAKV